MLNNGEQSNKWLIAEMKADRLARHLKCQVVLFDGETPPQVYGATGPDDLATALDPYRAGINVDLHISLHRHGGHTYTITADSLAAMYFYREGNASISVSDINQSTDCRKSVRRLQRQVLRALR
jgi:hypothetical protein